MTIINQITSFKISGFTYNGTDTQLNYTAGVATGTAQPSKALVLDAGSNINSINTMTLTNLNTTTLTINGTLITLGMLNNLNSLDGAIAGTGVANKVLILDSNRDITNIRNLNATTLTGTIQTASQPNITSIGTLSSLTLAGSLSGVTTIGASGIVSFTNTTISTNTTSGALIVSGGLGIAGATNIGGNLNVTGNIIGTLTTSSQPNITSIGTLTSLTLAGAISGVTNISANGNLTLTGHNGSTTGLILNSTLVTSTGTELNYLDLTTGPGTGEANKAIVLDSSRDITNIRNLTVTSLIGTNLTGTLQTASQPNITSVGTLSGLTLSGALSGVTTISASGVISFTNTTDSSSSTTGSLVISGGLGVAKSIISNSTIISTSTAIATSVNSGAIRSAGGLGLFGSGFFGHMIATGQTARTGLTSWGTSGIQLQTGAVSYTTSSTGTLASNVFSSFARPTLAAATAGTITSEASTVYIDNSPLAGTNMTITNAYALWINAGRTILKDSTTSTNSTSGALVVNGGVGIGGDTYIGGGLSVTGNILGTLATTNQPNITTLGGVTSIGASNSTTIIGILQTPSQTNITAVGTLTGLTSSGVVSITNTSISSSTSTGALIVSGGIGISGAINIGGSLSLNGNINTPLSIKSGTKTIDGNSVSGLIWNTTDDRLFGMRISEADTLALCWAGGGLYSDRILFSNNLSIAGGGAGTQFNTKVYINNTTNSTNTTSGALVVLGGVGIGNNLNIGGALTVTGNITGTLVTANQSNITTVGTLTGLNTNGVVSIINTTSSSSTTTGALVVYGGIGIVGSINIGGALSVTGNITGTLATANQSNITTVGTLTGLTSSGIVSITNTTESINSTSGSLVISGGVGVTGAINTINSISTTQSVGYGFIHNATGTNSISLSSYINTANTWAQFGTTTNHELRFMTNSISRLNISNSGNISIINTTASSSTTTGALVVAGGVGIGGALNVSGITKTSILQVGTSTDTTRLISALDGITTVGSVRVLTLGSASSPGNQAEFSFNYQGSNSNNNRLNIGFHSNSQILNIFRSGNVGINTNGPDRSLEINSSDGNCLRLTYNDNNGSATNYTDFILASNGNLTINSSGGTINLTNSTASSSITTGALVISGGVGITGNVYASRFWMTNSTWGLSHSYTTGGTAEIVTYTNGTTGSYIGTYTSHNFGIATGGTIRLGINTSGNVNIINHNGSTTGLQLNGTLITASAAELNYLSGITLGTITASKALTVDSSSNINSILRLTKNASNQQIYFENGTSTGTIYHFNNGDLYFGTISSNNLSFQTNGIARLTITNSGSITTGGNISISNTTTSTSKTTGALTVTGGVGIGGSLFCNALTVDSSGSTNLVLTGSNSSIRIMAHTDNVCYIQAGNGTGTNGSSNDLFIGNYGQTTTTSTRKFIIKGTTGNVGIGTSSPSYLLDVNGTVNISSTLTLNNNLMLPQTQSIGFYRDISTLDMNSYIAPESGNVANLTLYSLRGNGNIKILANTTDTNPIFLVNSTSTTTPSATDLFRILGNGNVGIGTNSPTSKLDVNGTTKTNSIVVGSNNVTSSTTINGIIAGSTNFGGTGATTLDVNITYTSPSGSAPVSVNATIVNVTANTDRFLVNVRSVTSTGLTFRVSRIDSLNASWATGQSIHYQIYF